MMNNGSEIISAGDGGKWAAKNLNSIMFVVVIGFLGWIGNNIWHNSITLAEMKGSLVNRTELEAKIMEIKTQFEAQNGARQTEILNVQKDLTALKLALAERGITQKQR